MYSSNALGLPLSGCLSTTTKKPCKIRDEKNEKHTREHANMKKTTKKHTNKHKPCACAPWIRLKSGKSTIMSMHINELLLLLLNYYYFSNTNQQTGIKSFELQIEQHELLWVSFQCYMMTCNNICSMKLSTYDQMWCQWYQTWRTNGIEIAMLTYE